MRRTSRARVRSQRKDGHTLTMVPGAAHRPCAAPAPARPATPLRDWCRRPGQSPRDSSVVAGGRFRSCSRGCRPTPERIAHRIEPGSHICARRSRPFRTGWAAPCVADSRPARALGRSCAVPQAPPRRCAARVRAKCRPRPLDAPVTSAVRALRSNVSRRSMACSSSFALRRHDAHAAGTRLEGVSNSKPRTRRARRRAARIGEYRARITLPEHR